MDRPRGSSATTAPPRRRRRLPARGASSRPREADRVWCPGGAQEDHLRQVQRHRAVLGGEVVPALAAVHGAAQAPQRLVGDPHRHHLAAAESDLDPLHLLGHRHPPRQSCPAAGSTSSVSTPSPAFGCRNATRLPLIPTRASWSISSTPASLDRKSTRLNSSHVRISYA